MSDITRLPALAHLRAGDTLVVRKLDRLGRSVKGLVDLLTCYECQTLVLNPKRASA